METSNAEAVAPLVLTRVLPFPRERVFRAWTEVEELKKWFGPAGMSIPLAEMDVRVGGSYRIGMKPAQGDDLYVVVGVFQEITPPERIVFTWKWEDSGPDAPDTLVTVELRPKGDGTELVLTHDRFPTVESRRNHEEGWTSSFDCLAEALAG